MKTIGIGLYGSNGHQLRADDVRAFGAEVVAGARLGDDAAGRAGSGARQYDDLDGLLADPDVELVSLCSPFRSDQANDAVTSLRAGKHVYAEKPCALTECDLDRILEAADETGMQFHEMAGTVVDRPYGAMRAAVQAGTIGQVVQVLAQKSYPWYDGRPADERIDGGLALQVGVYIGRFVEHIAGTPIASMRLEETRLGTPDPESHCRRAASFLMTLENGGVASGICNYLNPFKGICWGYEILRIFGTDGIVESNALTGSARILQPDRDPVDLDVESHAQDYFHLYLQNIRGETAMPLPAKDETSPTRWAIRAKQTTTR